MENQKNKTKNILNLISAVIILLILIFTIYGITNYGFIEEKASTLINNYGIFALFVISFLLDMVPQMVSPVIAIGLGLLAGINIYYTIIATVFGSLIGSIVGFAIGKKYMFGTFNILTPKKSTDKLTNLTNKYGKIIIPIAAISPLPYLPIALGAMNLSKKNFIIFGLIPRALGIVIYGILLNLL